MAGAGIIHADVRRGFQPRAPHFILLLVEQRFVLRQDAIQLARGNDDAVIMQFFQEQRLRDMRVVILVQDMADQGRAVVTAGQHLCRQRCQH